MKYLISGICGFVGSTLAVAMKHRGHDVVGFDSFIRPGSERNRLDLRHHGISVFHADARIQSDVDSLPAADFVLDAAANPSVLAGVDGKSSTRQLVEHNLGGTVNLLEYCKNHQAGFLLLSTSRVYSIPGLSRLEVERIDGAYRPRPAQNFPVGISGLGISEKYSTSAPVSLYGATKLASEALALEYGATFDFPVFVNRCGVLAGAGQFGRADQGIFSFWINAFLRKKPLRFIGFDGLGSQVRDCLHPLDLVPLLEKQTAAGRGDFPDIINVGGGIENSQSLSQLHEWCAGRFDPHEVSADVTPRPYDIPWMVLDSTLAQKAWAWTPAIKHESILEEIAVHAQKNPDWLELSAP